MDQKDKEIAQRMVETIHWLSEMGESAATGGNYSFRSTSSPDKIYISRSGIDKSRFQLNDFITVDLDGTISEEDKQKGFKASDETLLHTMVYRNFPAGCILHGHGLQVVKYSLEQKGHGEIQGLELLKAIEGIKTHDTSITIPVFDNDQDIGALAQKVQREIEGKENVFCFLLRGHGITVWGKDVFSAKRHYEAYRYLIELQNVWSK